jgi:hypothetical protein
VTGIIGLYESVLHVYFLDFVGEANKCDMDINGLLESVLHVCSLDFVGEANKM